MKNVLSVKEMTEQFNDVQLYNPLVPSSLPFEQHCLMAMAIAPIIVTVFCVVLVFGVVAGNLAILSFSCFRVL